MVRALRGENKYEQRLTIDVGINPTVEFVNTRSELFGIEVKGSFVGGDKMIEGRIEDADYFGRFVVHNSLVFLIPEDGDSESVMLMFSAH